MYEYDIIVLLLTEYIFTDQVRRLMFAEVCNYRPCAEGKSGNVSRWGTSLGQQAKGGADSKHSNVAGPDRK